MVAVFGSMQNVLEIGQKAHSTTMFKGSSEGRTAAGGGEIMFGSGEDSAICLKKKVGGDRRVRQLAGNIEHEPLEVDWNGSTPRARTSRSRPQ